MILFLMAAVQAGTPLLLATLGEIITERTGNLNLGVEGMMLIGAVFGFLVGHGTESPILAIAAGALSAAIAAGVYAFVTVTLRANQVVTGLALTILGTGVSGFIGKYLMGFVLSESFTAQFKPLAIPILSQIPAIGPILFNQNYFVYLAFALAIGSWFYIEKTRLGLNLKMVGENPAAADASGINVSLYKYVHIMIGGALCGLGGAYLSLVYVPAWQENLTAGRGWIAIALVIFSQWHTLYAILGSYLFGMLGILGFRLQQFNIPSAQYLFSAMPYLITIAVLIITSMRKGKKLHEPEGLGVPYFREDRH